MIISNPLNVHLRPKIYSKGGGKSITVPDQTMSLQEILVRFAHGQMPTGNDNAMYHDDVDQEFNQGIDIRRLDLAELHELGTTAQEAKSRHKNWLQEQNDKLVREARQKELDDYAAQKLAEFQKSTNTP